MVSDDGEGGLPCHAVNSALGKILLYHLCMQLPLQVGQHHLDGFAAIEGLLEETDGPSPFRHRWRAAEGKTHADPAQLICFFGKLAQ